MVFDSRKKTIDISTGNFTCIPIVTATASDDVNVFILEASTTQVIVAVSDTNYTGTVHIQAVERGC